MLSDYDWHINDDHKEAKRLNEMVSSLAKKLKMAVMEAKNEEDKRIAVKMFYRKYYTLTLKKTNLEINKSPTRDIILDYPWKDLNLNRFICLKIWEKINH